MLFPYQHVPHSMDKMQEYIDYIFYEVWCQAPWSKYNISLFDGKPELKEIIESFHHTEPKGADFFIKGIQEVFTNFTELNTIDICRFRRWYGYNNDIMSLCDGIKTTIPVTYDLLRKCFNGKYTVLCGHLENYFSNLYSDGFLKLEAIASKIGSKSDHFKSFSKVNIKGKCPFCGIFDMHGANHTTREAFDHFLPKSKYPFNSINFKNLPPACHHCNSSYKTTKDPLTTKTGLRRKAFYPYNANNYSIELDITIVTADWNAISPSEITISVGPTSLMEEIHTWLDLYGIDERYKAKICCENDGQYWLEQVFDEWQGKGEFPDEFMKTLNRNTLKRPFADNNFLKKAFLDGCNLAGLPAP